MTNLQAIATLSEEIDNILKSLRGTLENQLSLVLEKDSDGWQKAMQLYRVRNQIAHGNLLSERIDVFGVIQQFQAIQAPLTRP